MCTCAESSLCCLLTMTDFKLTFNFNLHKSVQVMCHWALHLGLIIYNQSLICEQLPRGSTIIVFTSLYQTPSTVFSLSLRFYSHLRLPTIPIVFFRDAKQNVARQSDQYEIIFIPFFSMPTKVKIFTCL